MELPSEGVWEVGGIPTQERSWNTQGFWATHLGSVPFHLVTLVRIDYSGQTPTVIREAE